MWQDLKDVVALDFDYQQQMIYWTEYDPSKISRMHMDGSDVQVSVTMTTMRMNDREEKLNSNALQ